MGLFDFFKKEKKGIDETTFNSKQYQEEILAFAQIRYFEAGQNYETVKSELIEKGLSDRQRLLTIIKLMKLNSEMKNNFQRDLDSGKITDIKIKPNAEHQKGNVDQDQVDKYIGFGAYQMDRGDLDNALELFDKAIELDDKATLAYANKGTLYSKKGDKEKALLFYNKALETDPNNIQILENKMDLLFETFFKPNESEFINTVKSILEVNPDHPNALIYMIQYCLREQDNENALTSVKKLFANYYDETVATQLLLKIFHKLPLDRALSEFEKYKTEIDDNANYQLLYCKGLYLKGIEKYDEAIFEFEQMNQVQEFSWSYYQMAIIKNLQNKTDEALELLKTTFRLEPELKSDAKEFPELENLWSNPTFKTLVA